MKSSAAMARLDVDVGSAASAYPAIVEPVPPSATVQGAVVQGGGTAWARGVTSIAIPKRSTGKIVLFMVSRQLPRGILHLRVQERRGELSHRNSCTEHYF